MFLLSIKLDRVSFETKGRQNLQKTADFLIECIVFCPLVPPSWISLVDPTSAMYASAIYVSYIYGPGRTFLSRMIDLLRCFRHRSYPIRLNTQFRRDLQWWISFFQDWNGISFFLSPAITPLLDLSISSDASGAFGCGAICANQ